MFKNIIIAILLLITVACWLKVDPECINYDNPNSVTIEYQCADLGDYAIVPPEVVQECRNRAIATRIKT
jgi:hypothetical protein